jgi:hypothetical protein
MRREGLEPPEPKGTRSTAGPAASYGLPPRRTSRAGSGIRTRVGLRRRFCRPAPSAAREPLHRSTSTPGGIRTPNHRIWSHGALPVELQAHSLTPSIRPEGFEPPTSGRGVRCSTAELQAYSIDTSMRPEGFEPPASGSVIRRSAPAELQARPASTKHPEGFEPSTSGLAVRRSWPAELQVHLPSTTAASSTRSALSPKHLEGFEPSASGLAVRRSWPAELQVRICLCDDDLRSRGSPARGGEDARHRESRSPGRRLLAPAGSPRGLRCSTHDPSCQKREGAPPSRNIIGRRGALPAPGAGKGCTSPTPDLLPWEFRNLDR